MPGTCTDKTHTSCRVSDALGARVRPFCLVSCRFGAGSVRSAQRNIYRVREDGGYLGGPGAHNLRRYTCPLTVTYFPAPTSAPGTLQATKTTAGSAKLRPGQPHIPTRHGGTGRWAPGRPRAEVGPWTAGLESKPYFGCGSCQKRVLEPFQWDEEPATPIAGYHGTRRTPTGP